MAGSTQHGQSVWKGFIWTKVASQMDSHDNLPNAVDGAHAAIMRNCDERVSDAIASHTRAMSFMTFAAYPASPPPLSLLSTPSRSSPDW